MRVCVLMCVCVCMAGIAGMADVHWRDRGVVKLFFNFSAANAENILFILWRILFSSQRILARMAENSLRSYSQNILSFSREWREFCREFFHSSLRMFSENSQRILR